MGFFSLDKKSRLGIDIGTAAIKIVELSKEANRFTLLNYGMIELKAPKDSVQPANQDIVAGIKAILQSAQITSKDSVASIPSFPTFATTITLPYLSEEEVAKAMPFEARKYIPVPLSEVQLDWAIVNVHKDPKEQIVPGSHGPTVDVFLVAVPKQEATRYQSIMKEAGLDLKALELENFALIRALVGNDLSPIVIINIGGRSTSILIVEHGVQRASHDYEIGGFEITKSIARSLGITVERAEALKRSFGIRDADNNIVRQAMSSLIDLMVLEVNKTIHNYEDQQKSKIAKILLVGGLANMLDFQAYFAQKLGRDVSLGNPLARVVIPPGVERFRSELNSTFVVSIGLAMREL
ncbi:MAG: type IV pilus assembly protein PilM [bacterium]|nr:type IV pilus assembly protein PilM [bacterium]